MGNKLSMEQNEIRKVVIIGESNVGKSSLIHYIIEDKPADDRFAGPTIGAAFMRWKTTINFTRVVYEIWDTAGQERFRSMVPMYLRHASIILLVYDATDPQSYNAAVGYWMKYIIEFYAEESMPPHRDDGPSDLTPPIILVENKIDEEGARTYAINDKCKYRCRTSAKTGEGIDQLRGMIRDVTGNVTGGDNPETKKEMIDNEYHIMKRISVPPTKRCCQ